MSILEKSPEDTAPDGERLQELYEQHPEEFISAITRQVMISIGVLPGEGQEDLRVREVVRESCMYGRWKFSNLLTLVSACKAKYEATANLHRPTS